LNFFLLEFNIQPISFNLNLSPEQNMASSLLTYHPGCAPAMPEPVHHVRNTSWPWFSQDELRNLQDVELGSATKPDSQKVTLKSRVRNFNWKRERRWVFIALVVTVVVVSVGVGVGVYVDAKKRL
jgi:hypothetical protein